MPLRTLQFRLIVFKNTSKMWCAIKTYSSSTIKKQAEGCFTPITYNVFLNPVGWLAEMSYDFKRLDHSCSYNEKCVRLVTQPLTVETSSAYQKQERASVLLALDPRFPSLPIAIISSSSLVIICLEDYIDIRELKHRRFWATDVNRKSRLPLWCVFHPFNSKSQVVNAKMRAL